MLILLLEKNAVLLFGCMLQSPNELLVVLQRDTTNLRRFRIQSKQFFHTVGSGSTRQVTCVETLLKKEIMTENPVLLADQCTRQFTLSFRYTYGLSNPWAGEQNEGGDNFLPWGLDPTIKADSNGNRIVIRGGENNTSPLFYSSPTLYG
jgi:hypothetical protein